MLTRGASRLGTCDWEIWTKSLAFAAAADFASLYMGFSIVVSPFDHLWLGCSGVMEKGGRVTTMHTMAKAKLVA